MTEADVLKDWNDKGPPKMASDAPVHYNAVQADAWASGYNTAAESIEILPDRTNPILQPEALKAADDAACRLDGMFRDIFNYEDRMDIIFTAIRAAAAAANPGAVAELATIPAVLDGGDAKPNRELDSPDRGQPFFSTQWEREEYAREKSAKLQSAETAKLRAALESIAGWRNVNIQGEYEHGLRDIIRSMIDCATAALEASTLSSQQGNCK